MLIGDDGAHQPRPRLVRATLNGREAGDGLHERVIDRLACVRAGLTETADRDVNDGGCDGTDRVLAGAHPIGDTGAKVLHEDVGGGRQPQQGFAAEWRLEIERH